MTLFNILLILHIIGGSCSLLLGLYILLTKKGNAIHKRIGKIYYYSMLSAAVLALLLSYLHPSFFLFIIGIFTAYMLITGKRYLNKKQQDAISIIDWFITCIMLIFGLAFISLGSYYIIKSSALGWVLIVFGGISLIFVYQDYINFKGRSNIKNYWQTTHIQRMMGSYIASATAFLVVNNTYLPGLIAWLLPTALLVPLIIRWSRVYGVKKAQIT
ncbi:MAG: hypothetical protein V4613_01795 [Bacteroidota bacterium]